MFTIPSKGQRFALAALAFIVIVMVGFGSDLTINRHPKWMIADELFVGLLVASVVYAYERQRSQALCEQLRVIRDMNAFVRNELQILYASLDAPEKTRVPIVERSVERIDWALRELLPGGTMDSASQDKVTGPLRRTA